MNCRKIDRRSIPLLTLWRLCPDVGYLWPPSSSFWELECQRFQCWSGLCEGEGLPMINLSSVNGYIILTKFTMETVLLVLGPSGRGHYVLNWPQGHLIVDSYSPRLLALLLDHTQWEGLPIQGSVFWPFYNFPGLHQGVYPGVRVAHWRGISLFYLDGWLVIVESILLLLQYHEQLLQLCWDLGIAISWESGLWRAQTLSRPAGLTISRCW